MKNFLLIILSILAFGCRSKKEVLKTEVRTSDTLFIKSEVIKAPVLNQSLTIEQICDTVTGEVVRFKKVFVVDGDSIEILTNNNNELSFRINYLERILKEKDSLAKSIESKALSESYKVIHKKDYNWIFAAFLIGLTIGWIRPWRLVKSFPI